MKTLLLLAAMGLQGGADPAAAIDSAVRAGITQGVYPGAVVVVGTGTRILHAKGYGHFTWDEASQVPDPATTLFDLASLTKVVAVTPAAMVLVGEGRLDLDRAVQEYLPAFRGDGKDRITVRHLLEHRSGLRAFLRLNELANNADEARSLVLTEPLRRPAGTAVEYSDLNAMLLGWVVEAVTGQRLDEFARQVVYDPAKMADTRYQPPRDLRPRIMPVGRWRGVAIAGEVHDQNAAILGGVSGHAGLYSTGADLARYAQVMLSEGKAADGAVVFGAGVVRHFTRRAEGNRALGWEMRDPDDDESSAGSLLSSDAYGHGGYTGTSVWIDPTRDLFVIVLTNRVFAPRAPRSIPKLRAVRAEVADWAVRLKDQACGATGRC